MPIFGESSLDSTMLLHINLCEKKGHIYVLLQQHSDASCSAALGAYAPAELVQAPQVATKQQFSLEILSLLRSLEAKVASFTAQPSIPPTETTEILETLKGLEGKIDALGQQQIKQQKKLEKRLKKRFSSLKRK